VGNVRWMLAGALSCCAAASPAAGYAAQSARLVYSRSTDAAACPTEAELRRAVARRLGYDPFVAVSNRTVVAEIRSLSRGLAARVYVVGDASTAGGARELTADDRDCTELLAAVALAISIAIDPDALDREVSDEATPIASERDKTQPSEATAVPPAAAQTPPALPEVSKAEPAHPIVIAGDQPKQATPPAATKESHWTLGVSASIAHGPTPDPTISLGLGAGLTRKHLAMQLEPRLLLPATSRAQPSSVKVYGYGIDWVLGASNGSWLAGILGEFDLLVSRGNVALPRTDRSWLIAAGPRLAYRRPISKSWFLAANVDGLVVLRSVDMRVDGSSAFMTPPLVPRGGVSVNHEW
jgi:hypothetical protein